MTRKISSVAGAALLASVWAGGAFAASTTAASDAPAVEIAASAAAAQGQSGRAVGQGPGQSLYERVGGIFAIAAVVDRFSDAIIENPKLNQNPALVAWNRDESGTRLAGLKVMRTIWIAAITGGPFEYTGLPLPVAHREFRLTEEEFNEVGAEIVRALDFYQVPAREKQELVDAYMKSKPLVVSGSRGPRDVSPSE